MLQDEELYFKLKNKLDKFNLNNEDKIKIVSELNYLSNLLIDFYLNDGKER